MSTDRITLPIAGMSCQHCVQRVQNVLEEVAGVDRAEVDLDAGQATIVHDGSVARTRLANAVVEAGYEVPAEA